jgi:hypothetical protein
MFPDWTASITVFSSSKLISPLERESEREREREEGEESETQHVTVRNGRNSPA